MSRTSLPSGSAPLDPHAPFPLGLEQAVQPQIRRRAEHRAKTCAVAQPGSVDGEAHERDGNERS